MFNNVNDLLAHIKYLAEEGFLAAEFDKKSGKMTNSITVDEMIKNVKSFLPEELNPTQAATKMRELDDFEKDVAIHESEGKVVDLRNEFALKMSKNGGAYGLCEKLVFADWEGDGDTFDNTYAEIEELVKVFNDLN